MSLSSRQQSRLAAVPAEQRAALRAHFLSQVARKSGTIAPPPGIPQPKRKPKPKAISRGSAAPPARPVSSPKEKARARAPRAQVARVHTPLPDIEAKYYVLPLNTVFEVSTSGTFDKLVSIGGYMGLGMGQSSGGSPTYPNPMVDLVATVKDAVIGWQQSIASDNAIRCGVINRPPMADTTRNNTNRRGRLSGLAVTVQCLGVENGFMPPGEIFVGKSSLVDTGTRVTTSYSLKGTFVDPMIEARTLHSFPAQELTSKAVMATAAPADPVKYREWNDFAMNLVSESWGNNELYDGMETIFVYVPRVLSVTVRYRLVVQTVWCLRDPSDVVIGSGSTVHKPTPHAQWQAHVERLARSGPTLVARSL